MKAFQTKTPTEANANSLINEEARLLRLLQKHRENILQLCPQVQPDEISYGDSIGLENVSLYLPSSYSGSERASLGLGRLAGWEAKLRIGIMHSSLLKLRHELGMKSLLVMHRHDGAHGYTMGTRQEAAIQRACKRIDKAAGQYNQSYRAAVALGVPMGIGTEAGPLEALQKSQLRILSSWVKDQLGQGATKEDLSWFWKMDGSMAHEASQANDNIDKVLETYHDQGKLLLKTTCKMLLML
jgi:hypothetical protein